MCTADRKPGCLRFEGTLRSTTACEGSATGGPRRAGGPGSPSVQAPPACRLHLQCVLRLCIGTQAIRHGGEEPVAGAHRARPGVQQHEAARAVRALRRAGRAALPQHGRLLIAKAACPKKRSLAHYITQ